MEKKANNSTPEQHDLQLNQGLEKMNSAEYYKTDFGLVIVSFKVRCTIEFPAGDLILSVMPEGLRPSHHVHGVATNVSLKGETTMAIWINPGGSICAKMPEGQTLANGQGISGFLSYFVSQ